MGKKKKLKESEKLILNYKNNLKSNEYFFTKNFNLESLLEYKNSFFSTLLYNRRLFKYLYFKECKANRLTNLISKLRNQSFKNKTHFLNFRLNYFLTFTYFCYSLLDSNIFIKNNLVFLNTSVVNNSYMSLQSGDIIELFFLKKYLIFLKKKNILFKKNSLVFKKKKTKLKKKLTNKSLNLYRYPNSGERFLNFILKLSEIDNQSFTIFILPTLSLFYKQPYFSKKRFPLYLLNLLN